MGLRYLGGRSWAEVTREERFFTQRLYELIRQRGESDFVSQVNHTCGISLPIDFAWEVAFEAAFYRDLWNHRGRRGSPFSPKRTFDLCLLSDDAVLIIEAKAHQKFHIEQLRSLTADREQVRKETGASTVALAGLASSRYQPPPSVLQVFDGRLLTWKGLAALYSNDPVLLRADSIYDPRQGEPWGRNNVSGYMTGDELPAADRRGERFLVGRGGGTNGSRLESDVQSGTWRSQRYETDRTSSLPPNRNWFWLREFGRLVSQAAQEAQ